MEGVPPLGPPPGPPPLVWETPRKDPAGRGTSGRTPAGRGSSGPAPGSNPGGAAPRETGSPAPASYAEALVDVRQLASILMASKGPIIDRIARQVRKFEGDGTIDVTEWLKDVDRLCLVERVRPTEVVEHLLGGGALRLFRSLMVSEANQWDVVKATLLSQYGLDPQEAYGRFTARKLLPGEVVDIYIDDLVRLGGGSVFPLKTRSLG